MCNISCRELQSQVQMFVDMKKTIDPVWKRWKTIPSAVDDCADITSGYEQQLELQLNKTIDATPEEVEEWYPMKN